MSKKKPLTKKAGSRSNARRRLPRALEDELLNPTSAIHLRLSDAIAFPSDVGRLDSLETLRSSRGKRTADRPAPLAKLLTFLFMADFHVLRAAGSSLNVP